MKFNILLILSLLLAAPNLAQAQDAPEKKGSLNSGTLEDQFNFLFNNSNRYQEFKVVKKTWLNTYWSHISDTLEVLHSEIDGFESTIAKQTNTISDLEARLSNTNDALGSVNAEKDSITFLGAQTEKGLYKKIMWGIVLGLLALLLVTLFRFRSSKSSVKSTRLRLKEIESELDNHKRRSLEKEQELKRELQDHINKMDSMNPPR